MYGKILKKLISLFLAVLLFGISRLALANTLETQLSSDQIAPGDTVTVTYTISNNTTTTTPDFSALQKDFIILSTNYGTSINIINGVSSTQTIWRLQLSPKRVGELTIPEVIFGSDKSSPRKLIVSATPVNQTSSNNQSNSSNTTTTAVTEQEPPVFVSGEISPLSPYVQSQVLYTFKLFFRVQLREPRLELPQIKDVTMLPLGETQSYQTTIHGQPYNVVEKSFAIFPKKTGTLTIAPLQLHAIVIDENINPFDDPFNLAAPKPLTVATKEFSLKVREEPANYQGGAWLPAKNISLTEEWSDKTTHWEAGTPVTRTITITAQGLRAEQLPDLSIDKINGVSVYVDKPKRNNNVSNDSLVGTYEQKVTYIPNENESFSISPLKFNWWNIDTNSNASVQLDGKTIQVTGAAVASNTTPAAVAAMPIVTPNASPATTQAVAPAATKTISLWFWVACVFFAAWIATVGFMFRKKTVKTSPQIFKPAELNDKSFAQACHEGLALDAQRYLLDWGRIHWPGTAINLASLSELVDDELFKQALQGLERALYAKKSGAWNGDTLLEAFQRVKRTRTVTKESKVKTDLLPPLNPIS